MGADLNAYIDANYSGVPVMDTEYDYRSIESLVGTSIPGVRIGLIEQPEDIQLRTGDNKVQQSRYSFLCQLFFNVPRIQDYDRTVEFELLDLKDLIYDWVFSIDSGYVSEHYVKTLEWDGIINIDRQPDYSLLEIALAGINDDPQPVDSGIGYMIIGKTFEVA